MCCVVLCCVYVVFSVARYPTVFSLTVCGGSTVAGLACADDEDHEPRGGSGPGQEPGRQRRMSCRPTSVLFSTVTGAAITVPVGHSGKEDDGAGAVHRSSETDARLMMLL